MPAYTPNANMADCSPETSCTKATLVSLRCFVFDSTSLGKPCFVVDLVYFISPSIRVFVFVNTTRTELNIPKQRECFFFASQFASKGKNDEGKEFTIAEGTVKVCQLHFSRFQAEISQKTRKRLPSAPIRCHLAQCFHWLQLTRATEVHLLGYYTVVFISCNYVRMDKDLNNFPVCDRGSSKRSFPLL